MQSKIDPLTGGLTFDNEQQYQVGFKVADNTDQEKLSEDLLKLTMDDLNKEFNPIQSKLSLQERYHLISSIGEEVLTGEDLMERLKQKHFLVCYDGFEPSGRMHIAQGLLKAINVNKLVDAGCIFVFWIADWFAKLNNKMGGNLDKIRILGQYFVEVWKAAGMKMSNVKFLWASEEINKHSDEYWRFVMDMSRSYTITRMKRCSQIMGRKEGDDLSVAQLLYPCMQCTDIFFLNVDICQLGMDQRKVNVIARDHCEKLNTKEKPIIVSHHMMYSLIEGEEKASKSNPKSAIFMEDDEKTIKIKVFEAYCPEGITEKNPCLDYTKYIIFGRLKQFTIKREQKNGGDITYNSYEDLEQDYVAKKLHPLDLKTALAIELNLLIKPVRDHFQFDPKAKKILEAAKTFQITR